MNVNTLYEVFRSKETSLARRRRDAAVGGSTGRWQSYGIEGNVWREGSPCTTTTTATTTIEHMGSVIVVAHVLPPPRHHLYYCTSPSDDVTEQHNTLLSAATAAAAAGGVLHRSVHTHTHAGTGTRPPPGFRVINRDVASLCARRPPTIVQNRQPSSRDRFSSVYIVKHCERRCVCVCQLVFCRSCFPLDDFVLACCLCCVSRERRRSDAPRNVLLCFGSCSFVFLFFFSLDFF